MVRFAGARASRTSALAPVASPTTPRLYRYLAKGGRRLSSRRPSHLAPASSRGPVGALMTYTSIAPLDRMTRGGVRDRLIVRSRLQQSGRLVGRERLDD